MLEQTSFDKMNASKESGQVDVEPLSKGKRILVYLADLFLPLILCFFLFNIATVPLGKAMTGFDEKSQEATSYSQDVRDILVGSKILFLRYQDVPFDYQDNLQYTYDVWLSYYAMEEGESLDVNHPQFGHKEENEVIKTYFVKIREQENEYASRFLSADQGSYFLQEGSSFRLNESAYSAVHPYFDPRDQISQDGQRIYEGIREKVFTDLYAQLMYDVEQNDLIYEGKSYRSCMAGIQAVEEYQNGLLTITLLIAYFLSWGIHFLLIPLLGKRRKTLTGFFLRVERVSLSRLALCSRGQASLFALYSAFTCFWPCFFLPISYIGFNALFGITSILVLSILSLLLMVVTIVFVLASPFNRSLEDILSRSAMLEEKELDKIYRARGYIV
ncbi:MAG: hypothetical protein J5736_01190 [Bacilli bacterium]|nr:hypothetical protein [Bacilli bacterium]